MQAEFDQDERTLLLDYARKSVHAVASNWPLPQPSGDTPRSLFESKACFVTLYKDHNLRGCTGVLIARQPLVKEVIETAASTAVSDPRFPPVSANEMPHLKIEISILTAPQPLGFVDPTELPTRLRPGIDGVTLHLGRFRGTFLPQVWQKIPDPVDFLGRLCEKMGLSYGAWRSRDLRAETYQVEEFGEGNIAV